MLKLLANSGLVRVKAKTICVFYHQHLHWSRNFWLIKKSSDVFIVSDSTKFGKTELTNICYPSDIMHVATDEDLPGEFITEFKNAGIDLILA